MNNQRAQEIATSSTMAHVTFNGVPIYIQHVDTNTETARIYPLDQPHDEKEVPLHNLVEVSELYGTENAHMVCPAPQD
ncbi:small, acid-soluble spore protein, H family [Paenibacillus ferrarius]|uniref:Small, acid-soluble spore protein, H family n=1 Tax=Paenibacillus ferrarius TaxID=1469647 RepID=A0A1V4HG47_9BACL|nr:small, acid-soluble spore protein, H family [Paenibacillus ferrarius]